MILDHLHTPPTAFLLAVLGFSLLIAGLDFARRRSGKRRLATVPASDEPRLDEPSKPVIVPASPNRIAESKRPGPIAGIAGLPHTGRAVASLPFANFLPLPKPAPQMPQDWESANRPVSWSR